MTRDASRSEAGAETPTPASDNAMSATDRTLVKPPEEQPEDPALRLDDASDRAVVLAGDVIDQLHGAGDVDQEDVEDLRRAVSDVEDVLEEIEAEGDR